MAAARRNVHGGSPLQGVYGHQKAVYGCQPIAVEAGTGAGGNHRLALAPTSQRTKEPFLVSNRSGNPILEGREEDQLPHQKQKDSKC